MSTPLFTHTTLPLTLFALLIGINAAFTVQRLLDKEIVEFDMNHTITTFEQDIAKSHLSDAQREVEIQRFTRTLDNVVKQYALDNKVTILVSPAIVSGARDVTANIQHALLDALHAQNEAKQTSQITDIDSIDGSDE